MPALLLDANALLWLLGGDDRLGQESRAAVEVADALMVSDATRWEISIKISIGKLAPVVGLSATLRRLGFERLVIEDDHLARLESLPFHHRDPFDRMLIAQALTERLTIMTADQAFAMYGALTLDARE